MFGYYSAITFITVFILGIETASMLFNKRAYGRRFIAVYVLIIIAALGEWLGVALDGLSPVWRIPHIMAKVAEFSVAPCIPALVGAIFGHFGHKNYVAVPIVIHFVLELISGFTGFIFGVTPDNIYFHGPFYGIYMGMYFVSIFYLVFCVYYYGHKTPYNDNKTMYMILAFILSAVAIQILFSDVRIDWLCVAIGSALLNVHISTEEQNKAYDAMKEAKEDAVKANLAKTSFLGRMSHDVRTPINGVSGMLKIAEKNLDNPVVVADCLKKIDSASKHLLSLINDVLEVTKLESGTIVLSREPFNLTELFRDCSSILSYAAKDRGVTITDEKNKPFEYSEVYGSPLHVRQIFINIVGNCIKYNKVGGFVDIRRTILSETEDKVTYRFTISDTGIGMSEEFLKHIYEPFSRENTAVDGKYQGTGLGMSIVAQLVNQMNGKISVMSEKNVGSVFILDLPFEINRNPVVAADEEEVFSLDYSGRRVLLVEDNDLNREIGTFLLSNYGFEVDIAADGREAVEKYEGSAPYYYCMVFMDIMMPVMNGLDATKRIRALNRADARTVPIVAMTANAYSEDRAISLQAGMDGHLTKPIDTKELEKTLKRFLA